MSLAMAVVVHAVSCGGELPAASAFRSPVAVAVVVVVADGADGAGVVTANADAGSLSLVDPTGAVVLDELLVGRRPAGLATRGATGVVATLGEAGDLVVVDIVENRLVQTGRLHLGLEPAGVAVVPDGSTAVVALSAVDRLAIVDVSNPQRPRLTAEVAVGRLPRFVAASSDGRIVAATCSADSAIVLVDVATATVRSRHPFKGFNLGQPGFAPDGRTIWFPWTYDGGSHPSPGNIRRGWVTGSRLGRLSLDGDDRPHLEGLTLDVSGRAVGDVQGLAVADDGRTVLVTAGGTHELLRLHEPARGTEPIPYTQISGLEVMDPSLAADTSRFSRLELDGRPLDIAVDARNRRAYVANPLRDSVHVIDIDRFATVREVSLTEEPSDEEAALVRRGQEIFFDATRSLDQWYSCHTCHFEGGGNTVTFDTLNDGSTGSYKTVLPLYGVAATGPWTWHGWQRDFRAALTKSLVETMQGPAPTEADVDALAAYLAKLVPPPSPFRETDGSLSAAAERGRGLFLSERAGCTGCHTGPFFTSDGLHDVGLARPSDRYDGFNPPALVGLHRKTRFLHTGKVTSLEDLLTTHHAPERVSGLPALSSDELSDLVAYLRSL